MTAHELVDVYDATHRPTGQVVERQAVLPEGDFILNVCALVENGEGRFLVTRRALDKAWAAGWWEVSGGGVRAGETSAQAIVREVSEETGLDISDAPDVLAPVYGYANVDPAGRDNYLMDIYHVRLAFDADDVTLQRAEAIDFALLTWPEVEKLGHQGTFLHFKRLEQALASERRGSWAGWPA